MNNIVIVHKYLLNFNKAIMMLFLEFDLKDEWMNETCGVAMICVGRYIINSIPVL